MKLSNIFENVDSIKAIRNIWIDDKYRKILLREFGEKISVIPKINMPKFDNIRCYDIVGEYDILTDIVGVIASPFQFLSSCSIISDLDYHDNRIIKTDTATFITNVKTVEQFNTNNNEFIKSYNDQIFNIIYKKCDWEKIGLIRINNININTSNKLYINIDIIYFAIDTVKLSDIHMFVSAPLITNKFL